MISVRGKVIAVLGELGDKRAVQPLTGLLCGQYSLCMVAIHALKKLDDKDAIQPLIRTLGYSSGDVRKAAANALDALGDHQWKPMIRGDEGDFKSLSAVGHPGAIHYFCRKIRCQIRKFI